MSRLKAIALTPIVLARDGISTTESLLTARLDYLINGAEAIGYDADGIAKSQTPSGANAMTLDGDLGAVFQSRRGVHILIAATGNDTGRTFTVVGTDSNAQPLTEAITGPGAGLITLGASRFYTVTSVTPDAATADAITIGVNGYIDFTVAYVPQHIAGFSAGDDASKTVTVIGENRYGQALSESIAGGNAGTVAGSKNFARVYRASISAQAAGATELGWDGLCESGWFVLNYRGADFNVGIFCEITVGASLTYAIQHTANNVFAKGFMEDDAEVHTHDTITGKTASFDGNYTNPPVAMRLALTAYASGTATARIAQGGRS